MIVRRFLRRRSSEQRALVAAALAQLAFAVALHLAPCPVVLRIARRTAVRSRRPPAPDDVIRMILWATDAAGRSLGPAGSCLARALAAQWLAAGHGVALPISIGVAKRGRAIDAHAWIAVGARFRVGADAVQDYRLLTVEPL